jgi:electron transfer flavoprotein alpha subunit
MSNSILIFVEQEGGELQKAGLVALQAARELLAAWNLAEIHAVVLGVGAKNAAEKILPYGLKKVYYSELAIYEKYRAVPYAAAFVQAFEASNASVGIAAATTTGKDFFPRVGVQLEAGQASDIIAVQSDGLLQRPMFAGDVLADVEITTERKLVTVRTSAFDAAQPEGEGGTVEELPEVPVPEYAGEVVKFEASGGDRPELTEAEAVVSGGRALQSEENFEKYIFPLADALGAAVGASRAAVDSGYAPNDWQVGQTGKIVAPQLYIAVGISGAIQHLAGMKDSKVIVAINKDGEAPIYEVADYGLVADLYEVLPDLTEKIKSARS